MLEDVVVETVTDPHTNYTQETDRADGFPERQAALLRWDLTALPPGTVVQAVSLLLDVANDTDHRYPLYEVRAAWAHDQATWFSRSSGIGWALPGAQGAGVDRGSEPLGVLAFLAQGPASVPLNAAGVAVVQRWVNEPAENHGLIAQDFDQDDGVAWQSCDAASAASRATLEVVHPGGTVRFTNGVSPTAGYAGCTDTTLANGLVPGANANGGSLRASGETGNAARILLAFDLSALPPSTRVLGARLSVDVLDDSANPYPAYAVLRPWSEPDATWSLAAPGAPWEVPGAGGASDLGATLLASLTLPVNGQRVTVPLTDAGVALVQAWVSGAQQNHGLAVVEAQTGISSAIRFADSEHLDPARRPALTLDVVQADGGPFVFGGGPDGGPLDADGGQADGDGGRLGEEGPRHFRVGCAAGGASLWPLALLLLAALALRPSPSSRATSSTSPPRPARAGCRRRGSRSPWR